MEEKVAASAFGLQEHGLYPSLLTRPFGAPPQNCQDRTERGGFRRSEKGFFFRVPPWNVEMQERGGGCHSARR